VFIVEYFFGRFGTADKTAVALADVANETFAAEIEDLSMVIEKGSVACFQEQSFAPSCGMHRASVTACNGSDSELHVRAEKSSLGSSCKRIVLPQMSRQSRNVQSILRFETGTVSGTVRPKYLEP
jgi:hypothetical protein